MMLEWTDILLRLGGAAGAGVILGINRDIHNKPIGTRTLGLVGLGAATAVVAAVQIPGMAEQSDAASRVIQGVMAGISFIGAGVILRDVGSQNVQGLTTAATVWAVAALGAAFGLAMWSTAAIALALALVLLVVVAWIERLLTNKGTRKDR